MCGNKIYTTEFWVFCNLEQTPTGQAAWCTATPHPNEFPLNTFEAFPL